MFGIDPLLIAALLLLGACTGFAAGLLGIGGGMLMVPFLTFLFTQQGFSSANVVHMAVATSLACILFTSVSSVRAHHAKGAVRWDVVRWLGLTAFLGTVVGAQFAGALKTTYLALFFGLFVGYSALQMLRGKKAAAAKVMPSNPIIALVGSVIGFISSFVGAGGGFITIPFLSSRNVPMHNAVASSAAMGFPIAAGGLLGYIIAGWSITGLPSGTAGYIYLPALAICAGASVFTAPFGARAAHAMPVAQLKRIFAVLLLCLSVYMLRKAYVSF